MKSMLSGSVAVVALVALQALGVTAQEEELDALAGLEQSFPAVIQDRELEITSFAGEQWANGLGDQAAPFTAFVESVVSDTKVDLRQDVALASGRFVNPDGFDSTLTGVRVCAADPSALIDESLTYFFDATASSGVTTEQVASGDVLSAEADTANGPIRAIAIDDIVWFFPASDAAASDIVASLPPPGSVPACPDD